MCRTARPSTCHTSSTSSGKSGGRSLFTMNTSEPGAAKSVRPACSRGAARSGVAQGQVARGGGVGGGGWAAALAHLCLGGCSSMLPYDTANPGQHRSGEPEVPPSP